MEVTADGGDALSGVAPDTESKESGVALRDLVPVLDTLNVNYAVSYCFLFIVAMVNQVPLYP